MRVRRGWQTIVTEDLVMWKRLAKSVRANILVGLALIAPLFATLWIVNFFFIILTNWIYDAALSSWLKSVLPPAWLQPRYSLFYRMLALVLIVGALYLIGLLTRNFIGRHLYRFGDNLLTRIPIIKTLYVAIRQVSESIFNSRRTLFKQVVAVQFPRAGLYSLGFLTSDLNADMAARLPESQGKWSDAVCVFVPTAPNPTTGFFLMAPRQEVVFLDIGVPDAMKMILSVGAVLPGKSDDTGKTLLDRLDEWMQDG